HQCDQNQVFPLQATPGIGQLAEANSDHRETLHRADLNRVIDEIRPVVGLFQWPQQRIKSQPHQPTPHCRPSHHGGGNRATTKKAEHYLQRLRSRTERQLDPGHQLDRQCNTPNRPVATHRTRRCRPPGWYRYGNLLAALGHGGARRDRLPQELWLADWFAVDCPREINSRRVFRRHVDWTGPRAVDTLSGAVSQSVHHPFFSAPSRAANRARLGRFHFSLLRLLPELSQLGLEVGPRGLILLGTCFVCQRALAPGTPRPLNRGGLVPPPFAFGSKLAILLTKFVATLQQGPHQNPVRRLCFVGALQDTLRSNRIGFHARAPSLRDPILAKQKPHFAKTTNAMSRSTWNPPRLIPPSLGTVPRGHRNESTRRATDSTPPGEAVGRPRSRGPRKRPSSMRKMRSDDQ